MTKFTEHRAHPRTIEKDIVVLYHAECTDGFGAAWAAWRHLGDRAQYVPVEHQHGVPEGLEGRTIYTIDFTYPREATERLMRTAKRLTSIDHHISAAETTRITQDGVFDNEHSGAMLAWRYFHPDEEPPFLIHIIEDQDLHRFAIPETEVISEWLDLFDFSFEEYSRIAELLDSADGRARIIQEGALIRRYHDKLVERLVVNTAYDVRFEEYRARAANTEQFHSEIATALAERADFGIAWRQRPGGVYVSLRSDGRVDVSKVAARYGGGGHAKASGFTVPTTADLPFEMIQDDEKSKRTS
jgi:nanoRNase/pAp phosphatase (c-di-AMP/oligoRNAs hydrolase)